jgi:hypothetical protein
MHRSPGPFWRGSLELQMMPESVRNVCSEKTERLGRRIKKFIYIRPCWRINEMELEACDLSVGKRKLSQWKVHSYRYGQKTHPFNECD